LKEFASKWFIFKAKGHRNVRAVHDTTFEVTKDNYLTPRGDCIIGISSEASARDLPHWLKESLRKGNLVLVLICSREVCDSVIGYGDPRMTLEDSRRMVFRRSTYVGPETVVIRASKAAKDLNRKLIENLKKGEDLIVAITSIDKDFLLN
jgi:hypothetical protein